MLTGIFDSHAHYDDAAFDADRELLLQMLPQQGICAIMNIGCSIESARQSIALAKNFPYIYTAIGIHPEFAAETTERELAEIRQMIDDEQVYAVGEIGLDYHYGKESVQAQKKIFDAQMQLAAERKLPVVIHSRDAAADTMEILRQYPANGVQRRSGAGIRADGILYRIYGGAHLHKRPKTFGSFGKSAA